MRSNQKRSKHHLIFCWIVLLATRNGSAAFTVSSGHLDTTLTTRTIFSRNHPSILFAEHSNDQDERQPENIDSDDASLQETMDGFLDQQFFDPSRKDNGSFQWFADLVESNYETAEALYVGTFFVILVVITQELLRMQLYGDAYAPFTKPGSGSLW